MSSDSDGSGRPDDIVIIKQLLQKLEEVAARDAETPREAPVGGPVAARATGETAAAAGAAGAAGEEPPLLVLRSIRSSPSTPSDAVEVGPSNRPNSSRDLVLTPISIDLVSKNMEGLPSPIGGPPRRRRSGLAVAIASFVLGIVAAGGLIVAFDPFGQRGGPKVARAPEQTKAPAAEAAAAAVDGAGATAVETSTRRAQISTPEATVAAKTDDTRPEPAASDTASGTTVVAANDAKSQEDARPVADKAAEKDVAAGATDAARDRKTVDAAEQSGASAPPQSSPVASSPAADKPVLRMASKVEMRAGERRSMDISVDGPADVVPRLLVVFRQVPGWMTFSKGGAIGNDIWLLPAPQVRDLEVEVSDGANGAADVKVQLARVDGSILSETTVSFTAAAREAAAVTAGLQSQVGNEATILRLQARGELLLDTGEVEAARTLLRTAAEAGSVAAALRLAETYDPAEMQRFGMGERTADVGQAVRWYEHAQALGSPVAAARLIALGRR